MKVLTASKLVTVSISLYFIFVFDYLNPALVNFFYDGGFCMLSVRCTSSKIE